MELGRLGIWCGAPWRGLDASVIADAAGEVEGLGYSALWMAAGFDAPLSKVFTPFLAGTERAVVASGISTVWHTTAHATAQEVAQMDASYPGRFLLGIGASHAPLVTRLNQEYERPYAKVESFLDELDADERAVPKDRRVIAALGPRMLRLAGSRSVGAHPYFVPVEHTARARETLGKGPLLAPEVAVVVETDPTRAREVARAYAERYLGLDNYANNLRTLGYSEEDLAGLGSDRVIDAVIPWGDVAHVAGRLREHFDAGADHLCLQVLSGDDSLELSAYGDLAEALS